MEQIGRVRWTRALIWIPILLLVTTPLFAETQSTRRTLRATLTENPPVIDGELTDPVWQHAEIATHFYRAKEGETHRAVFAKLAYLFEPNLPDFAQFN